jgi:hypothetical protein
LASLESALLEITLSPNVVDVRLCRSTSKALTNRDVYASFFKQLLQDDRALKAWEGSAPLKCKIFIWLAQKR